MTQLGSQRVYGAPGWQQQQQQHSPEGDVPSVVGMVDVQSKPLLSRSTDSVHQRLMYSRKVSSSSVLSSQCPLSTSSTAASSPIINASQPSSSTFRGDSPPSPGLTKSLLALAQERKKCGQHSLGSDKKLHLSPSLSPVSIPSLPLVDRVGIPDDLYNGLLSAASIAKKSGSHTLQRRRSGGLAGQEVTTVLVCSSSRRLLKHHTSMDTMPVLSPSLF